MLTLRAEKPTTLTTTATRTNDFKTNRLSKESVKEKPADKNYAVSKKQSQSEDRQRRSTVLSGKNGSKVTQSQAPSQTTSTKQLTQAIKSTVANTATTVALTSSTKWSQLVSQNCRTPQLTSTSQVVAGNVRRTSVKLSEPTTVLDDEFVRQHQLVKSASTSRYQSLITVRVTDELLSEDVVCLSVYVCDVGVL